MQLLSALSSTTSSLAMQALPLVAPGVGDFAALIAGMVSTADAAAVAGPVERQAAAPGGNGLPVAIAAPMAVAETPAVAAAGAILPVAMPAAVPAIASPLPVSATEAVLMLPPEADAPVSPPVVVRAAPVLAAAIGALAGVLPEEKTAEAPPRTEDVAVRGLPMPVPTRFATPQPRVKRTETAAREDAPVATEDKADEPVPLAPGDTSVLALMEPAPQRAGAVILPAAPSVADPAAQRDPATDPAMALVVEQGKVVAAEPVAANAPPMQMAKRRTNAVPTPASPEASVPQTPAAPTPVRMAKPAIGVVIPLDTDTVVPVHVVVPPAANDMAPARNQPGIVHAGPVDVRPATASPAGSEAPVVAGQVAPIAVDPPVWRERSGGLAEPVARPAAVSIDSIRQPEPVPSIPRPAAMPAMAVVPPADTATVPQAVADGIARSRALPATDAMSIADNTMPMAVATPPTAPDADDAVAADRAPGPGEAALPAAPNTRLPVGEATAPVMAAPSQPTVAAAPVAHTASAPFPDAAPAIARRGARTDGPAPIAQRQASVAAGRTSMPGEAAAPVTPAVASASLPTAATAPGARTTSAPLPDAASFVAGGTIPADSIAPVVQTNAPVAAGRAPTPGDVAAQVMPVAPPAWQPAVAAAPVARMASAPLPADAPFVAYRTDSAAPVVQRKASVDRAPVVGEAAAPVTPVAVSASQPAVAAAPGPAPAMTVSTVDTSGVAPVAPREAIVADRAPITGEAAAPVLPVASPAGQSAVAGAPITRIAPVPLPDPAAVVEASTESVAPAGRHAVDAPAAAPAAMPPVTRLATAPMVDATPDAAVAPAARARRDDDTSVPTTGAAPAPDAAGLRPVAPTTQAAQPALDTRQPQWVEGMIDRITTLRESGGTNGGETRIRLSPDALGDVEVAIRTGDDGKLHVHFSSENADAGRLLAEAQPRLVQMAEARGLKLGGMQVDVGSQQSHQSQRQAQDQGSSTPRAPRPATTHTTPQPTRSHDRIA